MFAHLDYIERHLREIEADIDEAVAEHAEALQLLSSILGVSKISASAIIAEIGTDMAAFPTSQHICSWAGLSPGNNSSAGKNKSTRVNKANPYLKGILCEVGWGDGAASHMLPFQLVLETQTTQGKQTRRHCSDQKNPGAGLYNIEAQNTV